VFSHDEVPAGSEGKDYRSRPASAPYGYVSLKKLSGPNGTWETELAVNVRWSMNLISEDGSK